MILDSWVSMVVFTVATVAFYTLGATVLHRQGLHPEKSQMIATLSKMCLTLDCRPGDLLDYAIDPGDLADSD